MKTSLNEENERKSKLLFQLELLALLGPLHMSLVNLFPIVSQLYTFIYNVCTFRGGCS